MRIEPLWAPLCSYGSNLGIISEDEKCKVGTSLDMNYIREKGSQWYGRYLKHEEEAACISMPEARIRGQCTQSCEADLLTEYKGNVQLTREFYR